MTKVIVDREKLADAASEAWDAADKGYDPMTQGEHGGTEDLDWLMRAATADAPSVDEVVAHIKDVLCHLRNDYDQCGLCGADSPLMRDATYRPDIHEAWCPSRELDALLTKLRGE